MNAAFVIFLAAAMVSAGFAALGASSPLEPEVVPAKKAFEFGEEIEGVLRVPDEPAAAGLVLRARVSDTLGRLVFDEKVPVKAKRKKTEFPFSIPPRGAVSLRHTVALTLSKGTRAIHTARANVILKPSRVWDDFHVMMWQRHKPERCRHLQEDGIRYSHWSPFWEPTGFIDAGQRTYIDNAVVPFYSPYHMWMPDLEKTHYFKLYRERFRADRHDRLNFIRLVCLANPVTKRILDRECRLAAQRMRDYGMLWYSLADEPGVGDQAGPSDFDWHPESLRDFREWLKGRYETLDALNSEWGTDYADWNELLPMTNDEGIEAAYVNPARWCDFKDYMDAQLCRAYRFGADIIKENDPGAYVGIGGVQGPEAVGGWDFYRMTEAFEVFESYYIGNNAELLRSLREMGRPVKQIWSHFGGTDQNLHYEWYCFLHGADASLIWDDDSSWVSDTGKRSPRAKKMRPMYLEQVNGLGRQIRRSRQVCDPVAIYYSQASLRVHWVRELKDSGRDWSQRGSWTERTESLALKRRLSWVFLVEDLGLQYRFAFDEQTRKDGAIEGFEVLLLPTAVAISDKEAQAVREFVASGGTAIADGLVGLTDGHGKPLAGGGLGELFGVREVARPTVGSTVAQVERAELKGFGGLKVLSPGLRVVSRDARALASAEDGTPALVVREHPGGGKTIFLNVDLIDHYRARQSPGGDEPLKSAFGALLLPALGERRLSPVVTTPQGGLPQGVEVFQWENGRLRFAAVFRNPLQRSKELGGLVHKEAGPLDVDAKLVLASVPGLSRGAVDVYDTRAGKKTKAGLPLRFILRPYEPRIFTLAPRGYAPGKPVLPMRFVPGKGCRVTLPKARGGEEEVYHVYVRNPSGEDVWRYGGNVSVTAKKPAEHVIPFALNDPPGEWAVEVVHVPTGERWNGKVRLPARRAKR